MSNLTRARVDALFDPASGKLVGFVDAQGREQTNPLVGPQLDFNREPTNADGVNIGITTAGAPWQANGVIYETVTAPTSAGATWQVATQQGGLPEPVIGAANIKFMGGTMAGKPGLNGKAIQITIKLATVDTTQDVYFINGEFDKAAAAAFMARADAGTIPEVSRVYHQLDDTVFAAKNGARNQLLIVWDPVIQNYMITGQGTSSTQLVIPATVTAPRNSMTIMFYGRGANACDSGPSGCKYGSAGDAAHYLGIAGYGLGGLYGDGGGDGSKIASDASLCVAPEAGACIVGLTSDPSTGCRLWANEIDSAAGNVDVTGLTLAGGFIGTMDGGTTSKAGQFRTMLMVIANVSVNQAKRDALRRWVYRAFNVQPQNPNLVVLTGDSRGMGTNTQYMDTPGLLLRQFMKTPARIYNIANGGATISDAQNTFLPNLAKLKRTGGRAVYLSIVDVNDINAPANPDVVFARKKAEIAAAKALGFLTVAVFGLRETNGSVGANGVLNRINLDTLNALYAAAGAAGLGADRVVNVGALQSASDPFTAAYYSDGIHQQGATNFAIIAAVAPVVDSLLTAP